MVNYGVDQSPYDKKEKKMPKPFSSRNTAELILT